MTNYQCYQKAQDTLHRLNDTAILQELRAGLIDGEAPREMRREDWMFALNTIDEHLAWLRSIYYPATKAEVRFKAFVEENIDRYAVA